MIRPLDRDTLLACFGGDAQHYMTTRDLSRALDAGADERRALRHLLRVLVDDGDLLQHPGRRYSLADSEGALVEGVVRLHRKGYGWLLPDDSEVKDAFVPPPECDGLMTGDRILCRISPSEKGPVASVVKVLARGRTTVTGVLRRLKGATYVESEAMRDALLIPEGDEGNAADFPDGNVVEALIVRHPTAVTSPIGRVIRSLGQEGEIGVEVERIVGDAGIVRPFSPEADAEAKRLPSVPTEHDRRGREDLREVALCTIDGATAKDFDDAVYAETKGKSVAVTVAIADVAHYVRPGTALDSDASERGTSVYYPGHCIPMLPEALSNGLCSLVPGQDRLAMAVHFEVSERGALKNVRFSNAVVHSHARLTYKKAQAYFDGDAETRSDIPKDVQRSLDALATASERLKKKRARRGAFEFDFVERVILVDDEGQPEEIQPLIRQASHKLIEDLMIAANEAVAEWFENHDQPCVYRIHEPPDQEKLERFLNLAKQVSKDMTAFKAAPTGSPTTPVPGVKVISGILDRLKGHRLKSALDYLLLRAMQQARYSADNVGHYGLGSEAYAHFTSPIRRYPDLMVHRELKRQLKRGKAKSNDEENEARTESLEEQALHCSALERRAVTAERSISALYSAWFMRDKIGETYDGNVSGCAEFGVFVRFDAPDVEGMIHVSTLGGDYFRYDELRMRLAGERSGFNVGIGDRVRATIANVDLERRQIMLTMDAVIERDGEAVELLPPPPTDENAPQGRGERGRGRGRGRGDRSENQRGGRDERGGRAPRGGREERGGRGGRSEDAGRNENGGRHESSGRAKKPLGGPEGLKAKSRNAAHKGGRNKGSASKGGAKKGGAKKGGSGGRKKRR